MASRNANPAQTRRSPSSRARISEATAEGALTLAGHPPTVALDWDSREEKLCTLCSVRRSKPSNGSAIAGELERAFDELR